MCIWIPFDGDLVEESSFRGTDSYKLPNEGISLHVVDYGFNSGRREVDPIKVL